MMIAYKVVKCVGDKFYSCYSPKIAAVQYEIGVESTPLDCLKDSLLMAFDSCENAEFFMYVNGMESPAYKLFICEVDEVNRRREVFYHSIKFAGNEEFIVSEMEKYWVSNTNVYISGLGTKPCPEGTVFCKSITIFEEVERVRL